MSGNRAFVTLTVGIVLSALGAVSAAASMIGGGRSQGGFVKACSLDGVNPVYHPEIFGDPAAARAFGFVLGPDRVWRVIPNCRAN